jgi:ATP-dependent protease ClpP protease subunit
MPSNVLPFSSPSPWFTVRAEAGGRGVLDIRGEIGLSKDFEEYGYEASGTVSEFDQAIKDLGNVSEIELNIYSGGGSVFVALAIHNILVRHSARVVANIDGFAGSAATILMLAADEIRIPDNAYLMIHNASMLAYGDHRTMLKAADDLRKWSRDIANLYTQRIEDNTGGERAAILADVIAKMDDETWLTGAEAKALGLVETVTGRVELAASLGSPLSAPVLAREHGGADGVLHMDGRAAIVDARPRGEAMARHRLDHGGMFWQVAAGELGDIVFALLQGGMERDGTLVDGDGALGVQPPQEAPPPGA